MMEARGWMAVHDCIAHPLMTLCPPVGNRIHAWLLEGPLLEPERGLDTHGRTLQDDLLDAYRDMERARIVDVEAGTTWPRLHWNERADYDAKRRLVAELEACLTL